MRLDLNSISEIVRLQVRNLQPRSFNGRRSDGVIDERHNGFSNVRRESGPALMHASTGSVIGRRIVPSNVTRALPRYCACWITLLQVIATLIVTETRILNRFPPPPLDSLPALSTPKSARSGQAIRVDGYCNTSSRR